MTNPNIPEQLTTLADGEDWEAGDIIMGRPLSRRAVAYLDAALRGWSREHKIEQLRSVHPDALDAYMLSKRKMTAEQVARRMTETSQRRRGVAKRYSTTTAWRLIRDAKRWMGDDVPLPPDATPEERLRRLLLDDEDAFRALVLSRHYENAQIAIWLSVSESTVDRLLRDARKMVGPAHRVPWSVVERFSARVRLVA